MSYFDFIAENFVIVFGAAGIAVTTMWNKIQPFLIRLLSPQTFPLPLPQPLPQPRPQPQPQTDDEDDTLAAVASVAYLIDYFKATKNTKGEAHARSAAKSIFEASTDVASR